MSIAVGGSVLGSVYVLAQLGGWLFGVPPEEVAEVLEVAATVGAVLLSLQLPHRRTWQERVADFFAVPWHPESLVEWAAGHSPVSESMAGVPGRGVGVGTALAPGTFILIQRGLEWDEVLLLAPVDAPRVGWFERLWEMAISLPTPW